LNLKGLKTLKEPPQHIIPIRQFFIYHFKVFLLKTIRKNNYASLRTASAFLALGAIVLVASVLYNWQVLAFIGLGLVFWGAIFSLSRPGKFVESSLLDSTANSVYSTLDRLINDLKYNGRGYYIPTYPKDAFLPDYFKNLKESVVFISDENFTGLPAVEELAAGKFLSDRDHGVFITSPGSGVLNQMERQLNLDFTTISISELCGLLPRCMTEFFNLAKEMDLQVLGESTVRLSVHGVLYESLYVSDAKDGAVKKSVSLLGCPVVSAVACALAKSSGKTVVIQEQKFVPNAGVEAIFNFVRG